MKNKLIISLSLLCIFSAPVSAATIYQSTTQNRVVYFGDTPITNGNPIQLSAPQAYPAATSQIIQSAIKPISAAPIKKSAADITFSYKEFYIEEPREAETIHSNSGDIVARIVVKPALQSSDKIIYLIDNNVMGQADSATEFRFKNVSHGEHYFQARIVDKNNQLLVQTKLITFYVHRAHISHAHKSRRAKHYA